MARVSEAFRLARDARVQYLPGVMEVNELLDAALLGFDRREVITNPPLHNALQWSTPSQLSGRVMSVVGS